MHNDAIVDTDVIVISDSDDEVEIVDLTADDVISQNPAKSHPKHCDSQRQRSTNDDDRRREIPRSAPAGPGYFPATMSLPATRRMEVRSRDHGDLSVPKQLANGDCTPKKDRQNHSEIFDLTSPYSQGRVRKKKFKKRQKKKRNGRSVIPAVETWTLLSPDSDFEEEKISPRKQHLLKPKPQLRRNRPPNKRTMLSLSKPVSHFPNSLYDKKMQPKLTNLHLKHGFTSETSSGSETDLLDPCRFLFHHQNDRAASPVLVDLYPTIKPNSCKREVDPTCNYPGSPPKKSKFSPYGTNSLQDSTQRTVSQRTPVKVCSASPGKSLLKNITKPLLTLSDFSSSEGEFEPCEKRVMRTPSKQNWRSGVSPRKTRDLGLVRPCRSEDRSVGAPIHIRVQDTKKLDTRNGNSSAKDGEDKSKVRVPQTETLDFCQRQRDIIEAVVDEEFTDDAIVFIRDFATLHRGAPEEYMKYLLKDVLLSDGIEVYTILKAYDALMHIHSLHPTSATKFTIDWDLVTAIVTKLNLETTSESTKVPCLGHVLALQFIVAVIMDDFQASGKGIKAKKSYSYSLLSADMCLGHVRNVIQWICHVVTNKFKRTPTKPEPKDGGQSEDRNVWIFLEQITKKSAKPRVEKPKEDLPHQAPRSEGFHTVLYLLQKLLLMSYAIGKSDSALKIAEELLYPYVYIPSLDQRTRCLQTLACDPVRSKLIELLLENLCELNAAEQQGVLSVRKIVECHFRARPMRVSEFVQGERDLVDAGDKSRTRLPSNNRKEECEELSMLLFFLLQSYIRNERGTVQFLGLHLQKEGTVPLPCCTDSREELLPVTTKSLQKSTSVSQLSQSANSMLSQPAVDSWLSMDDRECLWQMGDHREALERRLQGHCDSLTPRTRLYLDQIESLRELAC